MFEYIFCFQNTRNFPLNSLHLHGNSRKRPPLLSDRDSAFALTFSKEPHNRFPCISWIQSLFPFRAIYQTSVQILYIDNAENYVNFKKN